MLNLSLPPSAHLQSSIAAFPLSGRARVRVTALNLSSYLVHLAVQSAVQAGCVVVASAGNDGWDSLEYPARYPECISVGATDGTGKKTSYSDWGKGLDLAAPGGDGAWPIYQNTFADCFSNPPHNVSQFDCMGAEGTSISAPEVSALVAMMMSRGIRDPDRIRNILFSTAHNPDGPGWDTLYGYGLIDPVAALGGASEFYAGDDSAISLKDTLNQTGIAEPTRGIVCGRPGIVSVFPEPARDHVRINFALAQPGGARLRILDVSGRVVWRLDVPATSPGAHQVTWDGRDERGRLLPAGVYYARLETGAKASVERVVLIQ
jgi:subtilisin family serine protease